jgi:hypothetical protein
MVGVGLREPFVLVDRARRRVGEVSRLQSMRDSQTVSGSIALVLCRSGNWMGVGQTDSYTCSSS